MHKDPVEVFKRAKIEDWHMRCEKCCFVCSMATGKESMEVFKRGKNEDMYIGKDMFLLRDGCCKQRVVVDNQIQIIVSGSNF